MVVKVYHFLVYRPLPVGSVALTQTLYVVKYASPESDSDFVPLVAPVPLLTCPLLHRMVQEKRSPSESLMGILQLKLNEFPGEPFAGEGTPNTGGLFPCFVVNVYHLRVHRPLPLGSVALTQTLYVVKYVRPERASDFVPLDAPFAWLCCPLLQFTIQLKVSPLASVIDILQLKFNNCPVDSFAGDDVPNDGAVFVFVVN